MTPDSGSVRQSDTWALQRSLLVVGFILILLVGAGIWAAIQPLSEWKETTKGERVFAMLLVLIPIILLSFSPVALFIGFMASDRRRAEQNTLDAIRRAGWDDFDLEIRNWYADVFHA